MSIENKAVIAAMESALNARDWATVADLFAGVVSHQRTAATGTDFVRVFQDICATFPDWFTEIERMVAEEDWVVEFIKVTGTHAASAHTDHHGGLKDVPATGRPFKARQSHWWRLRDGKIIEHEVVRDDLGLLRQLGLAPEKPAPTD